MFDVRDLTFVAPNHPIGGTLVLPTRIGAGQVAGGGGGGGQPVTPSNTIFGSPADRAATIVKLLTDQVDTTNWLVNGGEFGSVSSTDAGLLFVTQTPANLDRVAAVLDELRRGRTGMVRVRVAWLLLPAGDARRLLLKNGPGDVAALPEVDRKAMDAVPHYAAEVACVSGQTVHVTSGLARTLVTAATPVVAPGAAEFDVQHVIVQYGLALEVTATAAGTDAVTLDLTSVASQLAAAPAATARTAVAGAATRPPAAAGDLPAVAQTPIGIDRFAAVVQSLQTTVVVPVGRPVLVGGMSVDPAASAAGDGRELYLVVEADTGK